MKMIHKLYWYSHAIFNVSETADPHIRAGQVSCRVRSYFVDTDREPTEQDAVREESHAFSDEELMERAKKRKAAAWDETDLKAALKDKLKAEVV